MMASDVMDRAAKATELFDPQVVGYTGDVQPKDAYQYLSHYRDAAMVDVRTPEEWQSVGVPDLADTGHTLHCISWKTYPNMKKNPDFIVHLTNAVPDKKTPIFFICRSGGRSMDAAIAASSEGWRCCFNVMGGFEGEPDPGSQRRETQGWKALKLPWCQTQ